MAFNHAGEGRDAPKLIHKLCERLCEAKAGENNQYHMADQTTEEPAIATPAR